MRIQRTVECSHGTDKYDLYESVSELPDAVRAINVHWRGGWEGKDTETCLRDIVLGDNSLVAKSDALLHEIEDQIPVSRGFRVINDVVGAFPDVPAYIAGHPLAMRRRQRVMRDTTPIAIFMDLTCSAAIPAASMLKRGIVLLALTRMLIEHRAVELWVGISLGSRGRRRTVAWRIDTAPLDLARAAHQISEPSMARGVGYHLGAVNEYGRYSGWGGGWPFESNDLHQKTQEASLKQAFPGSELMYIPPLHAKDPMVADPVGWLKRSMAKYVPNDEE